MRTRRASRITDREWQQLRKFVRFHLMLSRGQVDANRGDAVVLAALSAFEMVDIEMTRLRRQAARQKGRGR